VRFTEEHSAFPALVRDVLGREIAPHVDDWFGSDTAREGIAALLDKRTPAWVPAAVRT
jgi:hypothetical protein